MYYIHSLFEAYGFGKCERLLQSCQEKAGLRGKVATKFAPVPWRGEVEYYTSYYVLYST